MIFYSLKYIIIPCLYNPLLSHKYNIRKKDTLIFLASIVVRVYGGMVIRIIVRSVCGVFTWMCIPAIGRRNAAGLWSPRQRFSRAASGRYFTTVFRADTKKRIALNRTTMWMRSLLYFEDKENPRRIIHSPRGLVGGVALGGCLVRTKNLWRFVRVRELWMLSCTRKTRIGGYTKRGR